MKMENDSEQKNSGEKKSKSDFARFLGVASTVGINMVATTFVGFALGYWVVDKYLGTFPWFTIIFLFFGIVAGFKYLFKIAKRMGENEEE
jgi:ATP synthase protein I